MSDPTTWNAGDFHRWERPASAPCPDCECCSAALCARAIERDSACHLEGGGADFDLSACPCWLRGSAARARIAEHRPETRPTEPTTPSRIRERMFDAGSLDSTGAP